ncbi:tRNA (adenosine(37)-N6)-threonylcarbamoyltransferase complex transferase subunit TsaD [Candidatus Babeliales bacterium]|nr:tRNA (adenosine(37)-N6)-threonylcarbamoyltransferase complex transferase subunit TsaD [Candidatus Babeliales bacterium]
MPLILGIETSCDETAAAVYDTVNKKILSSYLFSQIELHKIFGGVVPEIASRSHLEKIDIIINQSLEEAKIALGDIDAVAVTSKPGLVGSLLIGLCFAKGIAWAGNKKLIAVDHLESHIFSAFLEDDGSANFEVLPFPHLCLSVSGGHTSFYKINKLGDFQSIGQTLDDAAGEAFDKIANLLGLGYPGGPLIEKLAKEANFEDFFNYPRGKKNKELNVSFSGLKTAVLYDLVKRGVFSLETGVIKSALTEELKKQVSSSLLVCIADIFERKLNLAFDLYPDFKGFSFVGGVSCNKYISERLKLVCEKRGRKFKNSPRKFSTDNAAMVALVGAYKFRNKQFSSMYLDVLD